MPDAVDDPDATSGPEAVVRANRSFWDGWADEYQAAHAPFLAGIRGSAAGLLPAGLPPALVWGPEGLTEEDAGLLGPLAGRDVIEVGCGAAQGSRWAESRGARTVALDFSGAMLAHAPGHPRRVRADAAALPLADGSFDVAFSAHGALAFSPRADRVLDEVARVLRRGGRWVFSVTHPIRWAFPDDPGPAGLTATLSYFDRRPYVEHGPDGQVAYAEFHRTLGDWIRLLRAAGFVLDDLVEPEWPEDLDDEWDAWSRLRGERIPGTAVLVCLRS